jgi:hypothetical protein
MIGIKSNLAEPGKSLNTMVTILKNTVHFGKWRKWYDVFVSGWKLVKDGKVTVQNVLWRSGGNGRK